MPRVPGRTMHFSSTLRSSSPLLPRTEKATGHLRAPTKHPREPLRTSEPVKYTEPQHTAECAYDARVVSRYANEALLLASDREVKVGVLSRKKAGMAISKEKHADGFIARPPCAPFLHERLLYASRRQRRQKELLSIFACMPPGMCAHGALLFREMWPRSTQ